MALEFATGTLNIGTGAATTNYSVTGKAPASGAWKVLILFWAGRPETTDAAGETHIQPGIGVAVSSSSRWAQTGQDEHAQTTTDTDRYITQAACVANLTIAGAVDGLADFVSFNSDGFTLVIDDAFAAALEVSYILLGGDDIANAETGIITLSVDAGDTDYTSETTFQPDFVLFAGGNAIDPPGASTNLRLCIGAATASEQAVLAINAQHGQPDADTASYIYSGEVLALLGTAAVATDRLSLSSFLSTGFRLNRLEGATATRVLWLALKGGTYKIGNFNTATDTTAFTEAHGMSVTPKGAMFLSANRAQSTQDTPTDHAEWSVGASDGSVNTCQYVRSKDAVGSSDDFKAVSHDQCYYNASNATTQVLEGEGHVNSFDATNINFQMTDADDATNFVWYIAFGNAPVTGISADITIVAETDVAQALVHARAFRLTIATEADVSQIIRAAHPRIITQTAETDQSIALAHARAGRLTQAAETDQSIALAKARQRQIAQTAELDVSQSLTFAGAARLTQALETDVSQAVKAERRYPIALATETDLSLAISRLLSAIARDIAVTTETDQAPALPHVRAWRIAQAAETDVSQVLKFVGAARLTLAIEVDQSVSIAHVRAVRIIQTQETDLSRALTRAIPRQIALANETDAAFALKAARIRILDQVYETDISQAFTRAIRKQILLANETDEALAIMLQGAAQQIPIAAALETDISQILHLAPVRALGLVSESDLSQAFTITKRAAIIRATTELDIAQALTAAKRLSIGQATETDIAFALKIVRQASISQVSETDLAQALAIARAFRIGLAEEIDSALELTVFAAKVIIIGEATETDEAPTIIPFVPWHPSGGSGGGGRLTGIVDIL